MSRKPRKSGGKSRPARRQKPVEPLEVDIVRLGARGDGIAETPSGPLYVPDTAPGDTVRVRPGHTKGDGRSADLLDVLAGGADRIEPACRHAGDCGGCQLQHLAPAAIARHKRDLLREALSRRGLGDVPVGETRSVPPATRRRLGLSALRLNDRTVLGFNARASGHVVDLAECPVARPELRALFEPLRTLIASVDGFGRGGDVQMTLSETGPDLLFVPRDAGDPGLDGRERLTAFAETHGIARIAWQVDGFAEPIAARHTPRISVAGIPVDLPVGTFLQPSAEGERILSELVLAAVPDGTDAVADLYAGLGSLSLPLAVRGALVHAAEGEAAPVAALRRAAAGLRLTAEVRDLAKDPLGPEALNRYGAVVFDPPRAGAAPQAAALARSSVPRVVAVSCNPATLARDLRTLVDGGYSVQQVVPVDQFTWSAHLEAVAVLAKE